MVRVLQDSKIEINVCTKRSRFTAFFFICGFFNQSPRSENLIERKCVKLFSLYVYYMLALKRNSCERQRMRTLILDNAFREAVLYLSYWYRISQSFVGRIFFLFCAFFHPDGLFAGTLLWKHLSHKHALGTVVVLLYFIHKIGARVRQIQQ